MLDDMPTKIDVAVNMISAKIRYHRANANAVCAIINSSLVRTATVMLGFDVVCKV